MIGEKFIGSMYTAYDASVSFATEGSEYCYGYVFTTVPFSHISEEFLDVSMRFFGSLREFLTALLYMLFYICLVLTKALIVIFPHAMKVVRSVYKFHRTQLTGKELVMEVIILTLAVLVWLFHSKISDLYSTTMKYIANKSKTAAKLAPHVFFFTTSLLLSVFGKKFIMPFTHLRVMPLFTLAVPAYTTFQFMRSPLVNAGHADGVADISRASLDALKARNVLWVAFAMLHSVTGFISLIPFMGRFASLLPVLKEFILVVSVWVQLSPKFTSVAFDTLVMPLLKYFSSVLPTDSVEATVSSSGNSLFTILRTLRILSESQVGFLKHFLQDGLASVLTLVFLFIPFPFNGVGEVVIAWVLPACRAAACVQRRSDGGNRFDGKDTPMKATIKAFMSPFRAIRNALTPSRNSTTAATTDRSTTTGAEAGTGAGAGDMNSTSVGAARAAASGMTPFEQAQTNELRLWLDYWLCLAVIWVLRVYGISMWPKVSMLCALWMQHSYFRGATSLIGKIQSIWAVMVRRNRETQLEREQRAAAAVAAVVVATGVTAAVAAATPNSSSNGSGGCSTGRESDAIPNTPGPVGISPLVASAGMQTPSTLHTQESAIRTATSTTTSTKAEAATAATTGQKVGVDIDEEGKDGYDLPITPALATPGADCPSGEFEEESEEGAIVVTGVQRSASRGGAGSSSKAGLVKRKKSKKPSSGTSTPQGNN